MSEPLLIEHGTVVTGGAAPRVLPRHTVCLDGETVARIVPGTLPADVPGRRIDAARKLVLPGFINAHTHFYSAFACGFGKAAPSADFNEVLRNLWWRLDAALTIEDCYFSALLAGLDSIRHGTTTNIDHHASPRAVRGSLAAIARAADETGLRAALCYEVSDRDGETIAREGLEENAEWVRACRVRNSPRLRALFGLHASFTLTDRTLDAAAAMGRDLGAGFHIHVAEAVSDQDHAQKAFGLRVVERLQRHGILGPDTLAAHAVHVNRAEMEILAATQTAVVHNPQSNLNNAVGTADLSALRAAGVRVGLGTDAMTTDMLAELRVAVWAQHARAQNPSVGFGEAAAALCAGNPAIAGRLFGRPLGELREGGPADVVLLDYDPATPLADDNVLGHLVFGASQAIVDTTIVAGRVLMAQRRLCLHIDEERIRARARELAGALWKRL
jgi:putative selenium metabolism protein SsnA